MFCGICGNQMREDARFCSACGASAKAGAPPQPQAPPPPPQQQYPQPQYPQPQYPQQQYPQQQYPQPQYPPQTQYPQYTQAPSLAKLPCPRCGDIFNFKVLGTKGATGRSWGTWMTLGFVGDAIASSGSAVTGRPELLNIKCNRCQTKFESYPLQAQPDEFLSAPCRVIVHRKSFAFRTLDMMSLYLNGLKVALIDNGKSTEVPTVIRRNSLVMASQYGETEDEYRFAATDGGWEEIVFDNLFMKQSTI